MGTQTTEQYNTQTLIGFGHIAWHFNAAAQGEEPNHYAGAIPAADVRRRLFNFEAVPSTLTAHTDAGLITLTEHVASTRSDTGHVFGVVGRDYGFHQYETSLLAAAERLTANGSALGISSAGVLDHGRQAWVAVSLSDTVRTPEGVEFLPYLLASGSHDGSLASDWRDVVTNVVCDNTHAIALGETNNRVSRRVRHTRLSADRIPQAHDAIERILSTRESFADTIAALCADIVTDREWDAFLCEYVPMPDKPGRGLTMAENKRDALSTLYNRDARCEPWRGTAWGVVQTVNTYAHHVASVRGMDRQARNMSKTLTGQFAALDTDTLGTLNRVRARATN